MNFIFLQTHPIQYNVSLFRYLTINGINLEVIYLSNFGVKPSFDKEFNKTIKWDIPLLEGYNFIFFKNYSPKASIFSGFFGLMNFGVINYLWNRRKQEVLVIIPGWNYFSTVLAILVCKLFKVKYTIRFESPLNQELLKNPYFALPKKIFLRKFVFKGAFCNFFIGEQNKLFQIYHHVPPSKLIFTPYSVDNFYFSSLYKSNSDKKIEILKELSIPKDKIILLTSGKLIQKKRPFDLLNAIQILDSNKYFLIFVGDGTLYDSIQDYISCNKIDNVLLSGFVNQSEIYKYYLIADIYIQASGIGETWGLSINEALNFNCKLVVSDRVGSSFDLVYEGFNGYTYKYSDVYSLASAIDDASILEYDTSVINTVILKRYSYENILANLIKL